MRDNGFTATATSHEAFDDTAAVLDQRRRAVRAVASAAANADDCALLLDALGLSPAEGTATVPGPRSAD
ncbi:hypothetical protein [Amycolatopsis alkalitolerans]|uniref:Uncharacterized protein n=1 Tax=Amycolatopsis alkalitolerans TaxID=2547244 RepID=A0A5C4M3H9_9PSEU|nr:hypothetical protein [Amycolatopsis alkalitolerans]TNC27004.1 hypothetical protein FG385_11300 [Amycolatopsis alkalitolerans]